MNKCVTYNDLDKFENLVESLGLTVTLPRGGEAGGYAVARDASGQAVARCFVCFC